MFFFFEKPRQNEENFINDKTPRGDYSADWGDINSQIRMKTANS